MLNEYLLAAYRQDQTKLANSRLHTKLAKFPLADLVALASGDPTAKLAYCGEPCNTDGPQSWLDKYKGSALFDKAVALEKSLLEADAAADAKRDEERAADHDVDAQRDALRMQKRMLDLDLALEQEGAAVDPEAKEEQGAQLIEQAQAQEAAAGKAGEPHEQAETAAIQQFRKAQAQETAAEGVPAAAPVKQAALRSRFLKEASAVGALLPETRSLGKVPASDQTQGAGAGEYAREPSEIVTGGLQVDKVATVKQALSHGRIIQAVRSTPQKGRLAHAFETGVKTLGANKGAVVDQADTLAQAAAARLKGGNWKRELHTMQALRKAAADKVSALLPGKEPGDRQALARQILKEYPDLAAVRRKEAADKVALSVGGLMQGAKALGSSAKGLATSAHAAGGLPQVAKSFGNVARGFAMKRPLAAAGIAAGAAGLGGAALGRATAPSA